MFRRLYETRFRSVILFGIIASAALAIAWAAISIAQTARGNSPVDYVQQSDGSILATGGIYSHWFDPIQDGMFMDSSSEGGWFGIGERDHTCVSEGHSTPYECARGHYTQLQTGDGSSVDTQRHGMVFKKVSDNYYELDFPALLYLYSHPNFASVKCSVGLVA